MKNPETTDDLVAAAEVAVSALERLDDGEPWAAVADDADAAVAAVADAARSPLFPSQPQPVGADLAADLEVYSAGFPRLGFAVALARLHRECLTGHPRLAAVLRGPAGRRRIQDAAIATATVLALNPTAAIETAVREFQTAVARQLHERSELEPWSRILAARVPVLRDRLEAARGRHEQHAAAEAERIEAEQAEAERIEAEESARVQRDADQAAAETERAATAAKHQADTLRARKLADALERSGVEAVRMPDGHLHGAAHLVGGLRRGDFAPETVRRIEAAVRAA